MSSPPPERRAALVEVPLATRSLARLRPEISGTAWERLEAAAWEGSELLAGRTVWSINSTARGGGVAEMMRTLLPYWRGGGIDARWLVLQAPSPFFRFTKRLHNLVHGREVRRPGIADHDLFERVSRTAAAEAAEIIAPGDVVVLQDPQTAGLVAPLQRLGAVVIWRCHVGADVATPPVESAWAFLLPYVEPAAAYVFTREAFVPDALDRSRVEILSPAIDPVSAKNQPLSPAVTHAILRYCGLADGGGSRRPPVVTVEGREVEIRRHCRVLREGPAPRLGHDRLVVALARWDWLKDPVGILEGFAGHVADERARLVLAGPAVTAVADDPEGRRVLAEARAAWRRLPASSRERIALAALPMADLDENGLIVNALQREAAVIVKKSLQEGFGLGVTEGMWKARPVVASRVGGHREQIEDGRTGRFVDDPADLEAFGATIDELLADPAQGLNLGLAGREEVRARFLPDGHFTGWMRTFGAVGRMVA